MNHGRGLGICFVHGRVLDLSANEPEESTSSSGSFFAKTKSTLSHILSFLFNPFPHGDAHRSISLHTHHN